MSTFNNVMVQNNIENGGGGFVSNILPVDDCRSTISMAEPQRGSTLFLTCARSIYCRNLDLSLSYCLSVFFRGSFLWNEGDRSLVIFHVL